MSIAKVSLVFLFCCLLSGCSVMMAASGDQDPDISALVVGSHKVEVEKVLRNRLDTLGAGRDEIVTYQYFTGDKKNYKRAAMYAVLDLVTLGLAEVVTTSVEGLQGDKHIVIVTYDLNKRVKNIEHRVEKAPLPPPEEMIGLEKQAI